MDMAPATRPANPAIMMLLRLESAAATPTIKLAVETMPSLAPRTAALSHPMRWARWFSEWVIMLHHQARLSDWELRISDLIPWTAPGV
jgi:hypothetical protein